MDGRYSLPQFLLPGERDGSGWIRGSARLASDSIRTSRLRRPAGITRPLYSVAPGVISVRPPGPIRTMRWALRRTGLGHQNLELGASVRGLDDVDRSLHDELISLPARGDVDPAPGNAL